MIFILKPMDPSEVIPSRSKSPRVISRITFIYMKHLRYTFHSQIISKIYPPGSTFAMTLAQHNLLQKKYESQVSKVISPNTFNILLEIPWVRFTVTTLLSSITSVFGPIFHIRISFVMPAADKAPFPSKHRIQRIFLFHVLCSFRF